MKFRQQQAQAHAQTFRLFAWFAVLLAGLVVMVNLLLAMAYKLVMPASQALPALFFETNSGLILLFVLGGCIIETQRLRDGGAPAGRPGLSPGGRSSSGRRAGRRRRAGVGF
ncbi:MAG: hypothetical protein EOP38_15210, partial [Rubrivivax sp.]